MIPMFLYFGTILPVQPFGSFSVWSGKVFVAKRINSIIKLAQAISGCFTQCSLCSLQINKFLE